MRPLVVVIVFGGLIVVAAGVLMVALPNIVGYILIPVVGIHISHETFLLATVRAGELLLTSARQAACL
jgi:hypothetical protein